MRTQHALIGAAIGALAGSAHGQFFEGFDGSFENAWGSFPFANTNTGDAPFIFHSGFLAGEFTTWDGATVYRVSNAVPVLTYAGMSPGALVLDGTEDIVEMRVNTLDNSDQTSCGVITMRIVSPGGPAVTVGLFMGNSGGNRVRGGSTIDATLNTNAAPWQHLSWVRLRFDMRGPTIGAWILEDDGTPIYWYSFSHTLADMQIAGGGLDLYLTVLQDGFAPTGTAMPHAAIDFVRVSQVCFADCDGNGVTNVDDVDCFVAAFTGGQVLDADCDGNYVLNVDDIDCFVASFLAGCP